MATYGRSGALLIGGLAIELVGDWLLSWTLLANAYIPASWVALVVLGVVAARKMRLVEIGAGYVGIYAGHVIGMLMFAPESPLNALVLFGFVGLFGLPYVVGAFLGYVLARRKAAAPQEPATIAQS